MARVLSRIVLLLVPLLLAAQPQVLPLEVDLKDSTSSADPMVTMCDLADGLAKYAAAPHDIRTERPRPAKPRRSSTPGTPEFRSSGVKEATYHVQ